MKDNQDRKKKNLNYFYLLTVAHALMSAEIDCSLSEV